MIGHVAKFTAPPGGRDALEGFLSQMFSVVPNEPGTLLYVMNRSTDEPDVIWFVELYHDEAAFDVHKASEIHRQVVQKFGSYLACPPEVHHFAPSRGHVLPELVTAIGG